MEVMGKGIDFRDCLGAELRVLYMQQIVAEAEIHADLTLVRALLLLVSVGLLGTQRHEQGHSDRRYQRARFSAGGGAVAGESED